MLFSIVKLYFGVGNIRDREKITELGGVLGDYGQTARMLRSPKRLV
ncbi:MAG: hypothetical protein ACYT04_63165 [Nostoc sp.]